MIKVASALAALSLLACSPAAAQTYKAPRTAFGQPDLQGTWTNAALTRIERPDVLATVVVPPDRARAFEAAHSGTPPIVDDVGQADSEWWDLGATLGRVGGQARGAWVVEPADGRLPLTEAGRRAMNPPPPGFDGPEQRLGSERCVNAIGSPAGPPMLNAPYANNYQIVQTADQVAIVVEMNHDVRIIRLSGAHPPAGMQLWMGDSIGHWEGETLVVETTNLNPAEAVRGGPAIGRLYVGAGARVIERFTRTARDEIRYQFTVEDPKIYARPWRAEMGFHPAKGPLFEFACHEGNYSMAGMLAGARRAEADARAASAGQAASAAPPRTVP